MKQFVSFEEKNIGLEAPTGTKEPYYPSISVPPESFKKSPKPGSKGTMTIQYEVDNVGKKDIRIKVLGGKSEGEISDDEFEEMDPDAQDKAIEKEMDKDKLVEVK